jgi:hypothetical protein
MEIYVLHNGKQLGPFSLENVWAQLDSEDLSAADYAWSVDIDNLRSLSDLMPRAIRSLPSDETGQKQKRAGRIRTALRVISSLVDHQLTTKRLFAGTVLLLIASWIYPPWILNGRSHGWFLVFDTTQSLVMQIDFGRLLLIDAIIAAAGGLLAWAAFHNWTLFRVAAHLSVYSLLIAPVVAVVFLVGFVLERRVTTKNDAFDPFRGGGAVPVVGRSSSQESEYGVLLKAAAPPKARLNLEPVDEFVVAPTDLKKISLFDVGVHGYKSSITGLYGRVRNGLSRTVRKIAVKASFYTSRDELIEVRTFWMKHGAGLSWEGPVFPNAPISFDEHLLVDHLPDGYKYQLEVTEARYVD